MHRIDAHLGGVRWAAEIAVDAIGLWQYTVQAWTDVFGTWRDELERKLLAGQHDLAGCRAPPARARPDAEPRAGSTEMSEGIVLLRGAAETRHGRRRPGADRTRAPDARGRGRARGREARHRARTRAVRRRRAGAGAPRRGVPRASPDDRRRPCPGPLQLVVRAVPALVGRAQGSRGAASAARAARLRRRLPAADPPDRTHQP